MALNADRSSGDETSSLGVDGDATGTALQTLTDGSNKSGSKKSVILILAGLVITGAIAGWDWLRKLPKD